jgi:hypothetical protein
LKDPKLSELKACGISKLPLVSCLNCAMVWKPQYFQLSNEGRTIKVLNQDSTEDWTQDEEDQLPVPLPETYVKLFEMKDEDVPINEENYDTAFDLFGSEYVCRLLGAPLYEELPKDLECTKCNSEMMYIATITQDLGDPNLISVVDFQIGEMNIFYYICKKCLVIKTEIQST